jgi:hypothetical protein
MSASQFFHRLVGKEGGVRKGNPVELGLDRCDDLRVVVAHTRDCRAARCIEVALPSCIDKIWAIASGDYWVRMLGVTVKHMSHWPNLLMLCLLHCIHVFAEDAARTKLLSYVADNKVAVVNPTVMNDPYLTTNEVMLHIGMSRVASMSCKST